MGASSSRIFVAERGHVAAFDGNVIVEVEACRRQIDQALAQLCEHDLSPLDVFAPTVADAVRYSLLGGGKRFRGILLLAAYRAAGGNGDATRLAAAIEMVHAYSLVHDDLPCMDDDDLRRGRATVHRKFNARLATIAGVAMVPIAARTAARAAASLASGMERRIVTELMAAAGAGGMIGGQMLDLQGERRTLDLAQLERIHRAKTGALVAAAALVGGLAAGAEALAVEALRSYGEAVGLAFQITDDVLDVTATSEALGKTAGRDLALQKSTYPALLGVDGATERAERLIAEGCAALSREKLLTPMLESIAQFVVRRSA
jgi:geranylgeranyl diphosphate synthase, type II